MYFKQFLHDETGCASYFLASRQSREAAIIDPQLNIQPYLDLAEERDYRITDVLDTHLHADHVSGNRKLSAATGARLWLHESADVRFPFNPLKDGQELHLGQLLIRAVHTPGHRPESVCLLVTNPPRSPMPSILLSGDTLFVGDVGRPDFGGPEGAQAQYASIRKLLDLEDYVEVFPAHFEGSCGKGMCGRPSTTIGFERRFNPVLQLSVHDFLQSTGEVPARPLNMTAILATNRGEADYAWAMPHDHQTVDDLTVPQAPGWLRKEWANMHRLKQDGVPILGFTWYSLTDQIDWDTALREKNDRVNECGLYDLDRLERMILRRVAREYFVLESSDETTDENE